MRDDQKNKANSRSYQIINYALGFPKSTKVLKELKDDYFNLLLMKDQSKKANKDRWKSIEDQHNTNKTLLNSS